MTDPTIDPQIAALCPPLSDQEHDLLVEDMLAHGVRDPLVLWAGDGILLDGHHRYAAIIELGIPPEDIPTVEIELLDHLAAVEWVIRNQLGRRNLGTWARARMAWQLAESREVAAHERSVTNLVAGKSPGFQIGTSEPDGDEHFFLTHGPAPIFPTDPDGDEPAKHGPTPIFPIDTSEPDGDESATEAHPLDSAVRRSATSDIKVSTELAQITGVPTRTLERARWLLRNADDEMLARLDRQEVSVWRAYKEARGREAAGRREIQDRRSWPTAQKVAKGIQEFRRLWGRFQKGLATGRVDVPGRQRAGFIRSLESMEAILAEARATLEATREKD